MKLGLIALLLGLSINMLQASAKKGQKGPVEVTGEIVDLACYIDHAAKGAGHKKCAQKCIKKGLPVGILSKSGDLYLLIGDHEPINDKLVKYAAETVTVSGKLTEQNGVKMISNVKIKKG